MQDIGLKLLKSPYMNFNISVKNFMPKYKKFLYGAVKDILMVHIGILSTQWLLYCVEATLPRQPLSLSFLSEFFLMVTNINNQRIVLYIRTNYIHNAGYPHV